MKNERRARLGRPPRRDHPTRITVLLPGLLRAWLRLRAAREGRDQGDIIAEGLRLYRRATVRRRKGASR